MPAVTGIMRAPQSEPMLRLADNHCVPAARAELRRGGEPARRGIEALSERDTQENHMDRHKFKIGQTVSYLGREKAVGDYKITQLLPFEGDEFQYRIRNTNEPHERVVKEHELDRAA
jgi:hypothetical protein